jgi:tetratricopeptide (TPR) repeat protein
VLTIAGHFAEGVAEYDAALRLAEISVGAKSQIYGEMLSGKGQALMALDRPRDAMPVFQRGCSILEFMVGDDSIADELCRVDEATALIELGRPGPALHVLDTVEPVIATSSDPADLANLQMIRADALRAKGRARDAIALYRSALDGFANEPDRGLTGQVEWGLALALAPDDPGSAREHVGKAIEIWKASAPQWKSDLARAEAFAKRLAR